MQDFSKNWLSPARDYCSSDWLNSIDLHQKLPTQVILISGSYPIYRVMAVFALSKGSKIDSVTCIRYIGYTTFRNRVRSRPGRMYHTLMVWHSVTCNYAWVEGQLIGQAKDKTSRWL
jgi:hypothetical protein